MKLLYIKYTFFILCFTVGHFISAQTKFILDTVLIGNDSMVIYSDKSWERLDMIGFSGILNNELHETINRNLEVKWVNPWLDNDVYTTENDLNKLMDTIWMCVVNEEHPDFFVPNQGKVNSWYGKRGRRYHKGIDLGFNNGDSINCVFDGVVRYAKYNDGGYGNLVIVRHYNGLETYYAHLKKINVYANQKVKAGDFLGLGGSTGRSTGPHLHFEVRFYGFALDPSSIIDFKKGELVSENLFVHKEVFPYIKTYQYVSNSKDVVSSKKYHTIKSGDTLYGLALKYKTSLNKICKLNNIKPEKVLQIGEKIRVS